MFRHGSVWSKRYAPSAGWDCRTGVGFSTTSNSSYSRPPLARSRADQGVVRRSRSERPGWASTQYPPTGGASPFGHTNIGAEGGPNTYTEPPKRPHERDKLLEIAYLTLSKERAPMSQVERALGDPMSKLRLWAYARFRTGQCSCDIRLNQDLSVRDETCTSALSGA